MASAEFDEALDYYLVKAGTLESRNFATAVGVAGWLPFEQPQISTWTGLKARRLVLHGFPYDLAYRVTDDTLIMLAVSSHGRRPGYWAGRR